MPDNDVYRFAGMARIVRCKPLGRLRTRKHRLDTLSLLGMMGRPLGTLVQGFLLRLLDLRNLRIYSRVFPTLHGCDGSALVGYCGVDRPRQALTSSRLTGRIRDAGRLSGARLVDALWNERDRQALAS